MEKKKLILFLLPFILFWHWFEPVAWKNNQGIKAYKEKNFDQALQIFMSAKGINPDLLALKNNTASTLYQMKKYQKALEEFSQIDPAKIDFSPAHFHYNLGNTFYRMEQFDKALSSYKKSLLLDPTDMETKKNYELTLKTMKENEDQSKEDENQDQQENSDQYEDVLQYLNQNEKNQMMNKKRESTPQKKEKDW